MLLVASLKYILTSLMFFLTEILHVSQREGNIAVYPCGTLTKGNGATVELTVRSGGRSENVIMKLY